MDLKKIILTLLQLYVDCSLLSYASNTAPTPSFLMCVEACTSSINCAAHHLYVPVALVQDTILVINYVQLK